MLQLNLDLFRSFCSFNQLFMIVLNATHITWYMGSKEFQWLHIEANVEKGTEYVVQDCKFANLFILFSLFETVRQPLIIITWVWCSFSQKFLQKQELLESKVQYVPTDPKFITASTCGVVIHNSRQETCLPLHQQRQQCYCCCSIKSISRQLSNSSSASHWRRISEELC